MDRQYVGIDFHRRRSVIVRLSVDGERLRCASDCERSVRAFRGDGDVRRGTGGGDRSDLWLVLGVDLLQELGATVHLTNPNALNWCDRRVKNDVNDATDLADMLRLHRLR